MEGGGSEMQTWPCPQCGDRVRWDAGKRAFACPSCGFIDETGEVVGATPPSVQQGVEAAEHDLLAALEQLPRSSGLGLKTRRITCQGCGATSELSEGVTASSCAFCGSPHVATEEADSARIRPETLIPFGVDKRRAGELFSGWLRGLWFRPNDLKELARLGKINGVYVPYWTFDAQTDSRWTAESGTYYYVEVPHTEIRDGKKVKTTRRERRVRWSPASGRHSAFYDDELVYASGTLDRSLIQRVEPFDWSGLVPYEPAFLSGWQAEEYSVDLRGGWSIGKRQIDHKIEHACAALVPGDTHRNLRVQSRYSELRYKHLLLPIWVAAYRYGDKTYRFLINGQTGAVSGEAPWSWVKIGAAVAVVLALVGLVVFGSQSGWW